MTLKILSSFECAEVPAIRGGVGFMNENKAVISSRHTYHVKLIQPTILIVIV